VTTKVPLCWLKLYLSLMCSVVVWEAPCLFHALHWLSDMQFDNVNFALHLKITKVYVTEFGQVISAWESLFTTHFSNSKVEFNRRQTIEVAYILAEVVALSAGSKIYYHIPCCINHLLLSLKKKTHLLLMKCYNHALFL